MLVLGPSVPAVDVHGYWSRVRYLVIATDGTARIVHPGDIAHAWEIRIGNVADQSDPSRRPVGKGAVGNHVLSVGRAAAAHAQPARTVRIEIALGPAKATRTYPAHAVAVGCAALAYCAGRA